MSVGRRRRAARILREMRRGYAETSKMVLVGLIVREAGKTFQDAVAEVREAVDFCRYYAARRERAIRCAPGAARPGGRTRSTRLHRPRRVRLHRPWKFPLAIFTGQIAAALAAGNAVVAKPAEQTPLHRGRRRAASSTRPASRAACCS